MHTGAQRASAQRPNRRLVHHCNAAHPEAADTGFSVAFTMPRKSVWFQSDSTLSFSQFGSANVAASVVSFFLVFEECRLSLYFYELWQQQVIFLAQHSGRLNHTWSQYVSGGSDPCFFDRRARTRWQFEEPQSKRWARHTCLFPGPQPHAQPAFGKASMSEKDREQPWHELGGRARMASPIRLSPQLNFLALRVPSRPK